MKKINNQKNVSVEYTHIYTKDNAHKEQSFSLNILKRDVYYG